MKAQQFDSNIVHRIRHYSIAVLLTGTAILFFACKKNDLSEIKAISAPNELPVMEANNFQTTVTDSGLIRYTLKAPKLLRFENGGKTYSEFPQGVEIKKYDSKQKIVSSITADYAKEFVKEQEWEAKNNVVVTNAKGDSLKTEHLIWDTKNEKIHTEEYVQIISEDKVITGVGLTSDQDMINWRIKNPKGTIYVSVDENNAQKRADTPSAEQNTAEPPELPKAQDTGKEILFK